MNAAPHSKPRARNQRAGIASGMLVCALVVLMAIVGLAFNVALVTGAHDELRSAAEASALAAAAELLDEGVLYGAPDQADDIEAARYAAVRVAASNSALRRPVQLELNPENHPRGDIVVGLVDEPTVVGRPLEPARPGMSVNTVEVSAARAARRGNPVGLWAGNLLGVNSTDASAVARATVDARVYGFRPTGESNVPVGSLAVDRQSWFDQAAAPAQPGVNDRFTVDLRTGALAFAPDGIPEIELRAPLSGSEPGNVAVLLLSSSASQSTSPQQQLLDGFSAADLVPLGGELSLAYGPLWLNARSTLDPSWIEAVEAGQLRARVWPLGTIVPQGDGSAHFEVTTFGAASMIVAWVDEGFDPPQLVILVQPCMLPTSTALVDAGAPANPWIAKLMLTR